MTGDELPGVRASSEQRARTESAARDAVLERRDVLAAYAHRVQGDRVRRAVENDHAVTCTRDAARIAGRPACSGIRDVAVIGARRAAVGSALAVEKRGRS